VPVAFSCKDHGADAGELAPTLRSMGHDGSHANGGGQVAVCFEWQRGATQNLEFQHGFAPALVRKQTPAVALALRGREGGATAELGDDCGHALRASQGGGDKPHVLTGMAVRRLTPRECERLQGFPDDYTRIPWRGKADTPDGPRYKALGNSMAVPVMRWIGERIAAVAAAREAA
jgi:DNA (cytosine-5)-methyltransferase 1